jgi:hypothetical protein
MIFLSEYVICSNISKILPLQQVVNLNIIHVKSLKFSVYFTLITDLTWDWPHFTYSVVTWIGGSWVGQHMSEFSLAVNSRARNRTYIELSSWCSSYDTSWGEASCSHKAYSLCSLCPLQCTSASVMSQTQQMPLELAAKHCVHEGK